MKSATFFKRFKDTFDLYKLLWAHAEQILDGSRPWEIQQYGRTVDEAPVPGVIRSILHRKIGSRVNALRRDMYAANMTRALVDEEYNRDFAAEDAMTLGRSAHERGEREKRYAEMARTKQGVKSASIQNVSIQNAYNQQMLQQQRDALVKNMLAQAQYDYMTNQLKQP